MHHTRKYPSLCLLTSETARDGTRRPHLVSQSVTGEGSRCWHGLGALQPSEWSMPFWGILHLSRHTLFSVRCSNCLQSAGRRREGGGWQRQGAVRWLPSWWMWGDPPCPLSSASSEPPSSTQSLSAARLLQQAAQPSSKPTGHHRSTAWAAHILGAPLMLTDTG